MKRGINQVRWGKNIGVKEPSKIDALKQVIANATIQLIELTMLSEKSIVDNRTDHERLIDNPAISGAVKKLMALKGKIEYQKATGRAAMNVNDWIYDNFIFRGYLTVVEFKLIPLAVFKDFDPRLYQAIMNANRAERR